MKYSLLLISHFMNPRNNGKLDDYNVYGEGYNPSDGDTIRFFIKVEEGKIIQIKYLVKGCPRAIASSSYTSELVKGMRVEDVLNMDESNIGKALELDDEKFDCIPLPLRTIKKAIKSHSKEKFL